jgi:hypothetical protein
VDKAGHENNKASWAKVARLEWLPIWSFCDKVEAAIGKKDIVVKSDVDVDVTEKVPILCSSWWQLTSQRSWPMEQEARGRMCRQG